MSDRSDDNNARCNECQGILGKKINSSKLPTGEEYDEDEGEMEREMEVESDAEEPTTSNGRRRSHSSRIGGQVTPSQKGGRRRVTRGFASDSESD